MTSWFLSGVIDGTDTKLHLINGLDDKQKWFFSGFMIPYELSLLISLAPGIWMKFKKGIIETNLSNWWLMYFLRNCPQMNATGLADDKSALVHVMACCLMATSHYMNQCWPRFMSPYGITRPHKGASISKDWQCHCMINNMYRLTTKIHQTLYYWLTNQWWIPLTKRQ